MKHEKKFRLQISKQKKIKNQFINNLRKIENPQKNENDIQSSIQYNNGNIYKGKVLFGLRFDSPNKN